MFWKAALILCSCVIILPFFQQTLMENNDVSGRDIDEAHFSHGSRSFQWAPAFLETRVSGWIGGMYRS